MKLRVYRQRNPMACGSPKPGMFDQVVQEFFYNCEIVPDNTKPNTGDTNKIGYFDDVVITVNSPISKSQLSCLANHFNGQNKFLTVGELSILADNYLRSQNPVAEAPTSERASDKRDSRSHNM